MHIGCDGLCFQGNTILAWARLFKLEGGQDAQNFMKIAEEQNTNPLAGQEAELLARCVRKDKAAWDQFVEQYSQLIYHGIYHCLRKYGAPERIDDVEDLYHSVFQTLLEDECKKLRQFQQRCSLASWIRVITAHIVIDWLRRERSSVPLDAEDEDGINLHERLSDPSPDAEEGIYLEQRREALKQA
ncbi:MAG: RNA polymerase sigma factor, partial [bacterium]|nr:RNA polymerase sigma factor [bacterium]